jgi:hypothetical protein
MAIAIIQTLVIKAAGNGVGTQQRRQQMTLGIAVAMTQSQHLAGTACELFCIDVDAVGDLIAYKFKTTFGGFRPIIRDQCGGLLSNSIILPVDRKRSINPVLKRT